MNREINNEFLIDANVVIRFLTNDDMAQSPVAYKIFKKAVDGDISLILTPLVIAECCWVLGSKRYGYKKSDIADHLIQLGHSTGIKVINWESVQSALLDFSQLNIDFVDAYLSALTNQSDGKPIITWNKRHFKRMDVEWYTPDEIIQSS